MKINNGTTVCYTVDFFLILENRYLIKLQKLIFSIQKRLFMFSLIICINIDSTMIKQE
jgi:hypothetical protein